MAEISVLMPAYNTEQYISASIQSVLKQSFTDFELIILNDGSTDNTHQVITNITDSRIKYYQNEGNKGLTFTRNRLIELSTGKYIAFIDSDDIIEPNRFLIQYKLLEADTKLGFVSASAKTINVDKTRSGSWQFDVNEEELKPFFLFNNPVVTSTITIRKSALPSIHFREDYPPCEDYDLWVRINYLFKGRVFPNYLASYRLHSNNISYLKNQLVRQNISKIISDQLEYYFSGEYSSEEKDIHISLSDFAIYNTTNELDKLYLWIMKLLILNQKYNHFHVQALSQVLYERVLKKMLRLNDYNFKTIKEYIKIKRILKPKITLLLRAKEMVILLSSILHTKIIKA